MERKDFLKGFGIVGAAAVLPFGKNFSQQINAMEAAPAACTLIPSETRGPYPLPASSPVSGITRTDIRETKTGILLTLTITVQNTNCVPIPGARVDIWHCDKDGYYSAYNNQPGYLGTQNNTGTTWLRGSLITDANGQVVFTTIYPGWYNGRVTHIHAEVYLAGLLQRTSQFAFPDSLNATVYTTAAGYTPHGINSIVNNTDNVFSDGSSLQLLNISGTVATAFSADHTFTINYTILPLNLLSFDGALNNGKTNLWWSTTNEINTSHFEIEKSSNAGTYTLAGTLAAKNNSADNNYLFEDPDLLTGNSYYRLKMVDRSGEYRYSDVVYINYKNADQLSVYPNPAKDKILLTHPVTGNNSFVELRSFDGRAVAYSKLQPAATQTNIDISILSKGVYLLSFINNNHKQAIRIIKN